MIAPSSERVNSAFIAAEERLKSGLKAGGWPAAFMLDKVADSLKGQVVDTHTKSEFV